MRKNRSRGRAQGAGTHVSVAAWHEAGHALAAMREGRWLVAVEVSERLPGAGVTRQLVKNRRNRFNPAIGPGNARASWEDSLSRYLSDVRVALAGPLAEAKAINRPLRALGGIGDLERCHVLAKRLSCLREWLQAQGIDCGAPIPERFNRERDRVRRWLARPVNWQAVEKIAGQLMRRRRITAREVLACYLEARACHQHSLPLAWDGEPAIDLARRSAA